MADEVQAGIAAVKERMEQQAAEKLALAKRTTILQAKFREYAAKYDKERADAERAEREEAVRLADVQAENAKKQEGGGDGEQEDGGGVEKDGSVQALVDKQATTAEEATTAKKPTGSSLQASLRERVAALEAQMHDAADKLKEARVLRVFFVRNQNRRSSYFFKKTLATPIFFSLIDVLWRGCFHYLVP